VEFPKIAIKEMFRILKTGGRLIVTDLDEHNFEFLREEQHDFWLGFKRGDIKNWFEEAGFREVRVSCVCEDCCSESEFAQRSACVRIFVASGIK
jgi:SAM-dependent methyltransferase